MSRVPARALKQDEALNVKRILISQPAPATEKSPYSELISKHDVQVNFYPFIAVEGVSLKEFRKQRVEILDHSAVIMTSRTAVDHFFRICEECRITVPESMKYFCVTEAIALYLQKYIVYRKRKIFFSTGGNFFSLMDVVLKHKDEKYLVPLSDPHKPEIPQTLTKAGVKFNKVILSHTVSADLSDIDINSYDILALYSPSDVNSLISNFKDKELSCKIAIFGASVASRALEVGIKVDIMAPTPKLPSLATALDKYISASKAGKSLEEFALKGMPEPPPQYTKIASLRKPRKIVVASSDDRAKQDKLSLGKSVASKPSTVASATGASSKTVAAKTAASKTTVAKVAKAKLSTK